MNSIAELQLRFRGFYQSVTNIVYTNGFIDPWLYDGITSGVAENSTVINIDCKDIYSLSLEFLLHSSIYISDYSSSADLTSLNGWDSYQLTLAKREIRDIINNWSIRN